MLSDAYNLLVKKADRTALETKCSDQATRLGISEANVVRLQQKYNVLNE